MPEDQTLLKKNKKTIICKIADFAVPGHHRINLKECEKKDKYRDLARELKKAVEHKSNDYAKCDWCFWHNYQRIIKRPGGHRSWRTGRDYSNDSIAKNGQNTETSPGDLRRLAVTQTPVKNHQLTLIWKTLKE